MISDLLERLMSDTDRRFILQSQHCTRDGKGFFLCFKNCKNNSDKPGSKLRTPWMCSLLGFSWVFFSEVLEFLALGMWQLSVLNLIWVWELLSSLSVIC